MPVTVADQRFHASTEYIKNLYRYGTVASNLKCDSGGGIEWVGGKSSLCFKPDDANDLAAKIEMLGNDYELRSELSKQCYIRLREPDVNYEKTIPAMGAIMEQLSNQSGKQI